MEESFAGYRGPALTGRYGEFLFMPREWRTVCATAEVRDALLALGVVGVELERWNEVAEWIWDE